MIEIKKLYYKRFFSSSLTDKKKMIDKNNALNKFIKINEKQNKSEILESAINELGLVKTLFKIGFTLTLPFCWIFSKSSEFYTEGGKTLTDIFNLSLNTITSTSNLFVIYF